jgi:hypothetical protein
MRLVVAHCDIGTDDLSAAYLRLHLDGSADVERLQPRDDRDEGALSAGGGTGENNMLRKHAASVESS